MINAIDIKQGRQRGLIAVGQERPLFEKGAFEQRPEEAEGVSHVDTWGKNIPGRGSSQCKGPEAGTRLICWRNSQEAGLAGAE